MICVHGTDVKIFLDKKYILRKASVEAGADDTDAKETEFGYQPEFYTDVVVEKILMLQKVPKV